MPAILGFAGDVAEWLRQRPAKPCTRVQFPASPPEECWSRPWKRGRANTVPTISEHRSDCEVGRGFVMPGRTSRAFRLRPVPARPCTRSNRAMRAVCRAQSLSPPTLERAAPAARDRRDRRGHLQQARLPWPKTRSLGRSWSGEWRRRNNQKPEADLGGNGQHEGHHAHPRTRRGVVHGSILCQASRRSNEVAPSGCAAASDARPVSSLR